MAVGNMDTRGNRGNSKFGQIPVKEGEIYDVEIEGIGEKGDGIAKIKGYVIIVPNVKKGDKVKVKVNAVRGKVSFGEVIGEASGADEEQKEENQEGEEESEDTEESDEEVEEESDEPTMDDEEEK